MTEWDGIERRAPVLLAEQLQPRNTVNAPVVLVLVGFAAVLLMQAASIFTHGTILDKQQEGAEFRDRITCYVIHTSQGETGVAVLTACGFLDSSSGGRR